jgi:sensor c-di-GMP phosphodiesterase-like protein
MDGQASLRSGFDAPNWGLPHISGKRHIGNTIMRTFRRRVWVAVLATGCGTAVGGFAGYLLGRALMLGQGEARLEKYATRIISSEERSKSESRQVLAAMSASAYAPCSDADVAYFSRLVFNAQYLKAAGRMRDGRIECSTAFHVVARDIQYKPNFVQRDGTSLYMNLAPFRVSGQPVIAVQSGGYFIVYSPYTLTSLLDKSAQVTFTDMDIPQRGGARPAFLTQSGQFRDANLIYGTHCSVDGVLCASAHIPITQALANNRVELDGLAVAGGLAGTLLGFVCAVVYRRQHGFESQLLRAIRKDALQVAYQPIVDLANEQIIEAEALVRWTNEDNVPVSPDDFIKVAEQRGFVGEITRLVVRRVLKEFGSALRERPGFRVNVNIAAADLADPGFLPMIESALAEAGVEANSLGIEITESYTARQQVAKETILRLRERGHYVHIDDFGTGYSSLAYLHDLSVDAIKIDKAFTRAIGTDAVTVSILPQILTMADTLGLRVIVEGIETQQQADYFAKAEQPVYAQGWLFGAAVPAESFRQMLDGKVSVREFSPLSVGATATASTAPAA